MGSYGGAKGIAKDKWLTCATLKQVKQFFFIMVLVLGMGG
jgi:hypothetical protein